MITYEYAYNYAKDNLSENRFKHSLSVVNKACIYSKQYNIDESIIKLVAVVHDIAKEMSRDEISSYIKKYSIKLDNIENSNNNLLHAIIAANIAKYEFGFTDDMVNAIRYHTTGRKNMSILEKIIYLADSTEDNKEYASMMYTDIIINNIDKGMVEITSFTLNKLLEKKVVIHKDTIECYNYYILNNL